MEYRCECCKYTTTIKANYGKHLKTTKHNRMIQKESIHHQNSIESTESQLKLNPDSSHVCKYCQTSFTSKQSMYRHIKNSCMKNKNEDLKDLIRRMRLEIETEGKQREMERKERETERKEFQKQMEQQELFQEKLFEQEITIENLMKNLMKNINFNDSFNNTINHYTLLVDESEISGLSKSELISYVSKKLLTQSL